MKTKYIDKLYLPKEYFVVEEFETPENRIVTTDFNEMIFKLGDKYLSIDKGSVKLSIYNLSANGSVVTGNNSIINSKNILAANAYHRYIFLSPSLDQIYSEVFHLEYIKGQSNPTGIRGYDYCYDYGILYGNYKLYHRAETTKTNYLEKEWTENDDDKYGILDIAIYNEESVNDIHRIVRLDDDIRCCYNSTILNEEKIRNTRLEDWYYDVDEGCIPVATFME